MEHLGGSTAVQPVIVNGTLHSDQHLPVATAQTTALGTVVRRAEPPHHVVYIPQSSPRPPLFCGMNRTQLKVLASVSSILCLSFWSVLISGEPWATYLVMFFFVLAIFGCSGLCAVIPVDDEGRSKSMVCGCDDYEHQAMATFGSLLSLLFLVLGTAVRNFDGAISALWFFFFLIVSIVGCIGRCHSQPDSQWQHPQNGGAGAGEPTYIHSHGSHGLPPSVTPISAQPATASSPPAPAE